MLNKKYLKIMNNTVLKYSIMTISLSMLMMTTLAQSENDTDTDLSNQQVNVTTTYTPVIDDAFRMESLPTIVDTLEINPTFKYDIVSKLQPTNLYPAPLQAAKLEGEPQDHLDNGYAKLGIGSKLNLNAEIYYMSTRNSSTNWGVYGKHQSAQGKIKNTLDKNVFAGYDDSEIGAFTKKMYTNTHAKAEINFRSNQHFFYGFNPINIAMDSLMIPNDREDFIQGNFRQRYSVLSTKAEAESRFPQIDKINYKIAFNYDLWLDRNKNTEHNIDFNADLNRKIKKELIGLNSRLLMIPAKYLHPSMMFVELLPYFKHDADKFKINLGLKTKMQFAGDSTEFHFYPNVHIQHNIANVLLPYASFTGNLQENTMLALTQINPYINDTSFVLPTNIKQHICVGLKGRISDRMQYNFNGQYIKTDNQYFFVTDLSSTLKNRYNVAYSNTEMFKAYAELHFEIDKFVVRAHGNYNHFTWIEKLEHAYHIPTFSTGLYAEYSVFPQLKVHTQAFVEGKRHAGFYDLGTDAWENIEPIFDVNIGAEYTISKQLNAYLQINNIVRQNYQIWYQYPVYGTHFIGGIKYSF
jgi:hypothetical protein